MPDKKLTDNEIIKALECCSVQGHFVCDECPAWVDSHCIGTHKQTLDLINRLQAENERLKKFNLKQKRCEFCKHKEKHPYEEPCDMCKGYDLYEPSITEKELKAEAYKECIEKVKNEIARALDNNYRVRAERIEKHNVGETDEFISYCGGKIDCLRGLDDFLDNLLKEMVGDK